MTRVIAIANEKGGVGKTTTALNLTVALANLGRRVLAIDLDPQGSLSAILRRTPEAPPIGVDLVLTGDPRRLGQAVQQIADRIWLLPATDVMKQMAEVPTSPHVARLQEALRRYRLPVDYIVIDTPPSVGWLTRCALRAAHGLLIPAQCQYMALRGVRGIMSVAGQVHRDGNPNLTLLGILATMYRTNSPACQQVLAELKDVFGDRVFEMVVTDDEAVATAPVVGRAIVDQQPWAPAAETYRWLAQEISDGRR